uniref:Putative secreted protein n=1 Tax=Panstrongylus lignarius TaxID=156445 RepID=A0A224Y372_9HEMI
MVSFFVRGSLNIIFILLYFLFKLGASSFFAVFLLSTSCNGGELSFRDPFLLVLDGVKERYFRDPLLLTLCNDGEPSSFKDSLLLELGLLSSIPSCVS